jgi:type I restriction enzyme M protein
VKKAPSLAYNWANLPEPDVLAAEIVEELESALEQFPAIAEDLGG